MSLHKLFIRFIRGQLISEEYSMVVIADDIIHVYTQALYLSQYVIAQIWIKTKQNLMNI